MDFHWTSYAGGVAGGVGQAEVDSDAQCRLVLNRRGLRNTLDAARRRFEGKYRAGLFQNNYKPKISSELVNLTPCNFSGYMGEQITGGWSIPVSAGLYAITQAIDVLWEHDGGSIGNFVYGYYIVDDDGDLVWAERFCPDPLVAHRLGETVRIRPTLWLVNDLL